jgi:hypothetical protein
MIRRSFGLSSRETRDAGLADRMETTDHKRNKRFKRLLASGAVFVFAAAAVSGGRSSPGGTSAPSHAVASQGQPGDRAKLVRVFVHEFDLYPSVVRTTPGKVLLRAENEKRSDIALVVERLVPGQSSQRTARIHAARHIRRAHQELTLGVGEYVFFEESRPELRGMLIVEPR